MATQTKNYKLTKPDLTEPVDITVLNANFDTIDEQMKNAESALPPVATSKVAGIVKPDGTTITVTEDGTIHGANTYSLPIAAANVLGGVKIGKNLTIGEDGTLNAYASLNTDDAPTEGSTNVPQSGGTYTMIDAVSNKVDALNEKVSAVVTGFIWKDAVDNYAALATAYPKPETGWTALCKDSGYVYLWNGEKWIAVYIQLEPVATTDEVKAVLEG